MIVLNGALKCPTVSHDIADMMHRLFGILRLRPLARLKTCQTMAVTLATDQGPCQCQDVTVSHTKSLEKGIALEEGHLIKYCKNFHDADIAGLQSPSPQLAQGCATLTIHALLKMSGCSLQPIANPHT